MSANKKTSDEPSIEEILDSIRQIISEDDGSEAAEPVAEPPPPPESEIVAPPPIAEPDPFEVSEPEEDIFELTERVEEDPPAKVATDVMHIDLVDIREEPQPEPYRPEPEDDEGLLSGAARAAAFDAVTALVRKTAVEHNGVTLEDIVRSEIKPLLRGWLDKNLPSLIERLVREELERVSKRVLED